MHISWLGGTTLKIQAKPLADDVVILLDPYKPEAGDMLVFPSGHPDYLTEDGKPYLHGVMPAYKKNKFLARMYWQKYQRGTDEWYEKEKEFGKDVWASMQPELEKAFRDKYPQRYEIKNGVRLR